MEEMIIERAVREARQAADLEYHALKNDIATLALQLISVALRQNALLSRMAQGNTVLPNDIRDIEVDLEQALVSALKVAGGQHVSDS